MVLYYFAPLATVFRALPQQRIKGFVIVAGVLVTFSNHCFTLRASFEALFLSAVYQFCVSWVFALSFTIIVLDNRLLTRRYGKAILNSLPPFERSF